MDCNETIYSLLHFGRTAKGHKDETPLNADRIKETKGI